MTVEIIRIMIYFIFPILCYFFFIIYYENKDKNQLIVLNEFLYLGMFLLAISLQLTEFSTFELLLLNIPIILSAINKKSNSVYILLALNFFQYLIVFKEYSILIVIANLIYVLIINMYNNSKINKNRLLRLFIFITLSLYLIIYGKNLLFEHASMQYSMFILIQTCLYAMLLFITINILNVIHSITSLSKTLNDLSNETTFRSSLFNITHEIKNPIAVCKGYLDMIDFNKKDHEKYIKIIKGEIDRTLFLINEFMTFTKVTIEKSYIDLVYLMEEIEDNYTLFLCNDRKILDFNIISDEVYFDGDFDRLKQVMINLIKNAIEAVENAESPKIYVDCFLEKNNFIIKVTDNGIGMSKATLTKINTAFFTTKKNGTGLGLAITREILAGHGATLEFESKYKEGTTAIVTIPL